MRLRRTLGRLAEVVPETPRTKSLVLEVPSWEGHRAGQHVDVRLTVEDGYQAQRSYSIASAPEDERLVLTVDRLDDGEASIYLTDVSMAGDKLEFRGPIGGYFTWEAGDGGPLFLLIPFSRQKFRDTDLLDRCHVVDDPGALPAVVRHLISTHGLPLGG